MRAALGALVIGLAVVVAACGGSDSSSTAGNGSVKAPEGPKALTQIGQGEGRVNLIA